MVDSVIFTPAFSQRFWAKVNKNAPNGCWEWTGCVVCQYGQITVEGKRRDYAHRVSYLIAGHDIQDGLQIDHLCRNTLCCNPAHLEAVTSAINTLRGESPAAKNARKTHCSQGHSLSGDNLYLRPASGNRACRICRRESNKARRQSKAKAGAA